VADAQRENGKRFIVHADEKLTAFVELEREVLTVTFYLESIHADWCRGPMTVTMKTLFTAIKVNERATGIEPAWPAWKAGTLPLSYARAGK
jgi:hypothetical protein